MRERGGRRRRSRGRARCARGGPARTPARAASVDEHHVDRLPEGGEGLSWGCPVLRRTSPRWARTMLLITWSPDVRRELGLLATPSPTPRRCQRRGRVGCCLLRPVQPSFTVVVAANA